MKQAMAAVAVLSLAIAPTAARESDAQVGQQVIEDSIAGYPRSCPCP
ncbi:hypothetical protein GCM10011494_24400 [Novosphingobium endophyticum]|uniref:Uncharacterized protein n=1 Tax=Novosphingobium endophyticum TaxID=1955250 RepID=A0A916X518_9SPHN|nr:hypothetical protein [Novosphingobium endophyticum]GGC04972.1 hypothetical protein GCM10011494_24400 [Novosphingobium endophyticum]